MPDITVIRNARTVVAYDAASGGHAYLNVGLGFPLIRTINEVEQSRARVHFSFNSQF